MTVRLLTWTRRIGGILLCLLGHDAVAAGDQLQPLVQQWLRSQTNIQTWSASVIQTRTLKTLAQPLMATGHVWFASPHYFRWEIGAPAKTIAVRQDDQMLVIYPPLKRAERYPLQGQTSGPWKETLALLEAGFPRSASDLQERFRVTSQKIQDAAMELTLEPRSMAARRMMPQIKIAFATNSLVLQATELQFTDGSTMRNEFSEPVLNPKLPPDVFQPELGADYKVVEPLKQSGR